jgi:hypothetical protein
VVDVLVVVFAVLLPLTATLTWAHYTVLNSAGFENTVGPLVSKPAVTSAIATEVTDQIFAALNPHELVANALPPKAAFLAGPITTGAKGYVQDGVTKVLQSPQFRTFWLQATRFAHSQLVSVLEGNGKAVTTTDGNVVLDLVPLLNASLQNIQGFASGVVGKPVTLPTLTENDIPAAACQKIAAALSRPVPTTCGQITLFPADNLVQARPAVKAFNNGTLLLLIVTPVLAALALWTSRRRRRTLLQLSVGGILGLVIFRRATIWLEGTLVNTGLPRFKDARQAILTQMLHGFFDLSRWLLVGLVVVFAVALITGPYPWAKVLRLKVQDVAREGANLAAAIVGRAHDSATIEWVRSHLDLLRLVGVAVAVVLLIALPVSFIGFLIIAVLLAAYEFGLTRLGRRARSPTAASPPAPPSSGVPPATAGSASAGPVSPL